MITVVGILMAVISVAVIVVVAIQPSKGEGLGSIGGGAQMFFAKNKGFEALLDKATWWLGALFAILAVVLFAIDKG